MINIDEVVKMLKSAIGLLVKEKEKGSFLKIKAEEIIIIGDLHGNLNNLQKIIKASNLLERLRNKSLHIIFLGDYVDRGRQSMEVFCTVLKLKLSFPKKVSMLRGNHETEAMNDIYGFKNELKEKYGNDWNKVYTYCKKIYGLFPYCVKTENGIFAVHGGIPINEEIDEEALMDPPKDILDQLLWNDPGEEDAPNIYRGNGYLFGRKSAARFLEKLGCKLIVRGHEPARGYSLFHSGITIFSAKLPAYLEFSTKEKISMKNIANYVKIAD